MTHPVKFLLLILIALYFLSLPDESWARRLRINRIPESRHRHRYRQTISRRLNRFQGQLGSFQRLRYPHRYRDPGHSNHKYHNFYPNPRYFVPVIDYDIEELTGSSNEGALEDDFSQIPGLDDEDNKYGDRGPDPELLEKYEEERRIEDENDAASSDAELELQPMDSQEFEGNVDTEYTEDMPHAPKTESESVAPTSGTEDVPPPPPEEEEVEPPPTEELSPYPDEEVPPSSAEVPPPEEALPTTPEEVQPPIEEVPPPPEEVPPPPEEVPPPPEEVPPPPEEVPQPSEEVAPPPDPMDDVEQDEHDEEEPPPPTQDDNSGGSETGSEENQAELGISEPV